MKLGIVVVYLFTEEWMEKLLDLHLNQIEKHTNIPYVIYGSVNRLAPKFRRRIEKRSQVRIFELPETDLRGGDEHAYYLDRLVRIAAEDGASHIVTLHLDSFPVRSGWAEELAGKLSESCVIATIEGINTACLFFGRDFYLRYRPPFRLSEAERLTPDCREYIKRHNPINHSGIGYGYTAYSKGLSWYYMEQTDTESHIYARVYDGMIFHVGHAGFLSEEPAAGRGLANSPTFLRLIKAAASAYRASLPLKVREVLRSYLSTPMGYLFDRPRELEVASETARIKQRLLDDAEEFLKSLTGRSPCTGSKSR